MTSRSESGLIVIPANGQHSIPAGKSNYLYCYDQSGLVEVTLRRDRQSTEVHMMERFGNLQDRDFDEFIIKDKSGSNNTVRFFFGPGQYGTSQDRASVNIDGVIVGEVEVTNTPTVNLTGSSVTVATNIANTGTALDDVTVSNVAVAIATGDPGVRLELMISIPETETNGIRIGGSDVTATKGGYIPPGTIVFVPFESTLYAIRDGAADVKVTMTALRRVA
ncbi:MAG: hypothetical protein CMQ34_09830 [Gammaproteobacteria bacterium]|nr:hypothetical protein [Gammaproteobacteria bacterium]|tara:strand:+ start:3375 stop:4037 length:663 start_codon:yes stop_codon:yes gene_type:complete